MSNVRGIFRHDFPLEDEKLERYWQDECADIYHRHGVVDLEMMKRDLIRFLMSECSGSQ